MPLVESSKFRPAIPAALCAVVIVAKIMQGYPGNQWDFKVYYYAAAAWANGVNPYIQGNLPIVLDQGYFSFTYPPYILPLFWPFTLLPVERALLVFLGLKMCLLASLFVTWSRVLGVPFSRPSWLAFVIFGFASTVFVDVASGNIVVIEQLILWTGLAAFLRQQYARFVLFVVGASLFKLIPIALLALCVWIPRARRLSYAAIGLASFLFILTLTYVLSPELTTDFFRHVSSLDERGGNNPALLPLIRDVSELLAARVDIAIPPLAPTIAYLFATLCCCTVTWATARRIPNTMRESALAIICLVLLTFAVVSPRMKVYAYILAVAPVYYVATQSRRLPAAIPLLVLACLTTNSWITRPENVTFLWSYWSWLIALGAWTLLIWEAWAHTLAWQSGSKSATGDALRHEQEPPALT